MSTDVQGRIVKLNTDLKYLRRRNRHYELASAEKYPILALVAGCHNLEF
jgi:hypothetical protein